jgi:hypothetical protein
MAPLLDADIGPHTSFDISRFVGIQHVSVNYDVMGFYERYFEGKSWTNNVRDIYQTLVRLLSPSLYGGYVRKLIESGVKSTTVDCEICFTSNQ